MPIQRQKDVLGVQLPARMPRGSRSWALKSSSAARSVSLPLAGLEEKEEAEMAERRSTRKMGMRAAAIAPVQVERSSNRTGVTSLTVELEDLVENIEAKLVMQAAAKTNDLAGDVAAGANPVQIARGIEKTTKALVSELWKMSKEVRYR
ncbi:hypothetical protein ZWY2020_047779 [Hordeum vulgare]|nr:hypothetical protein ZWY2020_047779 [Hordeum vulgare]